MKALELLAPARNKDIGIAAIDCGADAVYIAGPEFGARKAAGNSYEDIEELCRYAHRFGCRIFVTFNTTVHDDELENAHAQMLRAQQAGADAFIIRDTRICGWDDITVPLHASTQCAIRDVERARLYESLGCSRIVLERQLPLDTVREICSAVACEVEFFVHGALCVCYSGDCRLSERIDGRSADRGECIQACRSLWDLVDENGRVLVHNKALLSLKDLELKDRLEDLAGAGVVSFKIEGRLKNASYVKNVVRDYSLALDDLCARFPREYRRASFGRVCGGFEPDTAKTFNRGYTQLYLDGKRGQWSSMDAPKSMGEFVGTVKKAGPTKDGRSTEIVLEPASAGLVLRNGDGFSFSTPDGVKGVRGDVCEGRRILCKPAKGLKPGMKLFRNLGAAFEKELESKPCRREIQVSLRINIHGDYVIDIEAVTEDGRKILDSFSADVDTAENRERAEAMLREQLGKRSGIYSFSLDEMKVGTSGSRLPLLSASTINSMRRLVAEDLDCIPCGTIPLRGRLEEEGGTRDMLPFSEKLNLCVCELMRSKYCVRYELGMCPVHQGAKAAGRLFVRNNGRSFALGFDCGRCEMTVTEERK